VLERERERERQRERALAAGSEQYSRKLAPKILSASTLVYAHAHLVMLKFYAELKSWTLLFPSRASIISQVIERIKLTPSSNDIPN
jgi:hypothetical protein